MRSARLVLLLVFIAGSAGAQPLAEIPDPQFTPGVTNSDVTQDTIDDTICVPGWTKTIRPAASYTNKLKLQQMSKNVYDYVDEDPASFEEDHLISLEIGGHPTDPKNLWPEPWIGPWGARVKDRLETRLKHLVCNRQMTLKDAQTAIRTNWPDTFCRVIGGPPC